MNMGIGKGKSDKIDIEGLIGSSDNENKILQVEHGLTENIAELKQTTAALNAAIDRMESIVVNFNNSVQEMKAKKIGAQVHPQTLKSLNNICTNFVVEVGRQLMAHRDKQLELQEKHEKRIALLERIKAEKERLIKEGKIKRIKKSAKASDTPHYQQVPFEVPEGWVWCKLGDVFQHNNGKQKSSSNQNGKLLKYITTSNVYWGRFDLSEIKEMRFLESELAKCTAKRGDLLVCEGGDIGRAAIWDYDQTICFQNHLHRLRGFVPVCTKYFLFSLMFCKIRGLIKGKGIGLMTLSANDLHNIHIPLPPLAEQQRIVTEVDRWFALIGQIEQSQSDLQTVIQLAKSKILDLAIHGKLVPQDPNDEPASKLLKRINPNAEITCDNGHYPQLPKGWINVTIKDVCENINGLWKGKKEPFVNVGVIRNANFTKDFKLDYSNIEYIDVEERAFAQRHLLNGDLIVEKSGGSDNNPVGRAVLYEGGSGVFSYSNFTMFL